MKELEYRTRGQRGCNIFGQQPKSHIALYNDNCTSHSTEQQAAYLKRKNIHIRPLLPEATHIQQQVDNHIGIFIKRDMKQSYWEWSESILDEVDDDDRDPDTEKVSMKEVRGKIFEFAFNACEKLSRKTHLLESSYINWGIELPEDGSLDGDVSTIHIDGRYSRYEDIEIYDDEKGDE